MAASTRTITRRRLYQDVVAHLETQIHDGTYRPGDELPSERSLMKDLGVGRPAIREALFALQTMGLVALRSGERPRVVEPSHTAVLETMRGPIRRMIDRPDGRRNFQRARVFFEVGIVREAAMTARPADVARLEEALAANRGAIGVVGKFEKTDVEFHLVLAEIPGSPVFLAIHDAMFDWLYEQRRLTLSVPGQIDNAYR